jgi:hypothetical protein
VIAALIAKLLATAGVSNLVSTRIRPVLAHQTDALPLIVVHQISHRPEYSTSATVALAQTRVQIDCWGKTMASAQAVGEAVKAALSGQTFTQSGVTFQGSFVQGERHSFEGDQPEARRFRCSLDFQVWHTDP